MARRVEPFEDFIGVNMVMVCTPDRSSIVSSTSGSSESIAPKEVLVWEISKVVISAEPIASNQILSMVVNVFGVSVVGKKVTTEA